jgi:hypothetical protein
MDSGTLIKAILYFVNLFLKSPTPKRPAPIRKKVDGSGTGDASAVA